MPIYNKLCKLAVSLERKKIQNDISGLLIIVQKDQISLLCTVPETF